MASFGYAPEPFILLCLLVQSFVVLALAFLVSFWPFFRKLIYKSPLRHLPGPPRASFTKGNLGQLFDQQGWSFHRDIVRHYGGVVKIHGLCGDEQIYVSDPKALNHVINKDQDIYEETEFFTKTNLVCFGPGIVAVVGEQHRKQRKLMSPVFNVHNLRGLTPIFHRVSHELVDVLKSRFDYHGPSTLEIEMFYWLKRTALEIVGQAGLGYSFGPLGDESINEYSDSVKNFSPTLFRLSILRQFLPFFSGLGPAWLRRIVVRSLPIKRIQRLREIVEVMDKTARLVYAEKCTRLKAGDVAVQAQIHERRDMMSVLLRENMLSSEEDKLNDEEFLGQMSILIFAGQDTTAAAFARILQTLAEHPEEQVRLRNELKEANALEGGDLDYDSLHALPFLDAVCRETLRLYPPVFMLHRTTTRDAILPLSVPIQSADQKSTIAAVTLLRNTNVIIAIEAANRRPDIWGPDATEWRPERWMGDRSRDGQGERDKCSEEGQTEGRLPGVYSGLMT
ncbi:cytochrome P450, partial [Fomitiporia mediterranea MF3/22]|uniref:cytochrome P450 n=1 Tax=Fomitiporia mediterranea (strain MF3/22) TaxID=694068 RepID=UPI0004408245